MSANIQFMETVNLLSPDKGDMSGFSGPPYISARCDVGALGSLSLVSSEPACTCSLRGSIVRGRPIFGGGVGQPVHV